MVTEHVNTLQLTLLSNPVEKKAISILFLPFVCLLHRNAAEWSPNEYILFFLSINVIVTFGYTTQDLFSECIRPKAVFIYAIQILILQTSL